MSISKNRQWNERFNKVMPWGSSTCSKAAALTPEEPEVIVKGKGCRIWDADGREFIDFRNSLGPITLGYQFPAVDDAIKAQLENGIVFGHPHPIECEVAEMLCEVIPCAEQARFLKTGGEAVAACIRIARHVTGRDHIVQIGYNGWVNSLAAGGMTLPGQKVQSAPPGVPGDLSALHHGCGWNDMDNLEKLFSIYKDQIAAVIVAADYAAMEKGKTFYPALREITSRNGSLLIYDEIVTGFRVAIGGVQEYFGVTPDMAVFSKGIANGMPLSAYVGKKEVMSGCNRGGATVSSTFGGEALSLAAAKAAIKTYKEENVVAHLWKQGEKIWGGLIKLFEQYGIEIGIKGFWPCPTFISANGELKNRFFRAAFKNGVSLYSVSYVNYSHKDEDIAEALSRLEKACKEL